MKQYEDRLECWSEAAPRHRRQASQVPISSTRRLLRINQATINVLDTGGYAEQTDEELLHRVGAQDASAFEVLYDRHAGHVTGMCIRRLGDPELAQEIAQDIFTQLWRDSSRFDPGRARFTTWLFTIVRNRCIDARRAAGRRPVGDELPEELHDETDVAPEVSIFAEQCRERLAGALATLPDAQRRAVELCVLGGKTHTEAAEELGEPLGTLKSRVKIGLDKLKNAMTKQPRRAQ